MQGRVEQADRDRQAVHRLEDADEVGSLQGKQCCQRRSALGHRVGQDEPLDQPPALAEEHVLGPAQADALCAVPTGTCSVVGRVGVGQHTEPAPIIGVLKQPVHGANQIAGLRVVRVEHTVEVVHNRRLLKGNPARVHGP